MNKIGEGKTAEVFSDGQYAYKKYRDHYDIRNIEYEVKVQNEIFNKTNLNVCHYDIENNMIKMTLLNGIEFADRIRLEKYKLWLEDFTDLQCQTYEYDQIELLDVYQVFNKQVMASSLDDSLKNKALVSLSKIDKIYKLCHLDFHPLNIIYTEDKYFIIDWTNAKLAHPVMDIASTYIIFRQYLKRQANKYLNMMIKKTGYNKDQICNALPIMAFIKLRESDHEDNQFLIDLINGNDLIYDRY
ncbi:phosphotransferase [Hujiaoplasma nucleasis]|uniref:Phosphotransferase n=1 Tax=Hujiaoplasma nucleasis TaxID=2725268 RepID=A0A7L6N6J4_9MOLU|nr:phosphotransferase [Hujiaoplasma nucleasis]QLY40615.1 phosphotransferase [Hujiaoplasma nucleasis]